MTGRTCAFTSIAANYIPKARVLAAKRVSPDTRFYLMLVDNPPADFDLDSEPFDAVITVSDLDVDDAPGWCFAHSVVELCTAVKGMAACYLLDQPDIDKVFYFDPDMVVFGRMEDLKSDLDTASILLTPHQSEPEQSVEAIMDNEMASLKHGVFNLGFVGIRDDEEGRRFAAWWADRLKQFCLDDIGRGLFTDQKWANLVPCFFDNYRVLRSPAYNVATWNISTRDVQGSFDDGFTVNGEPLGFYHFSGFDSGDQAIMLNKYGANSKALQALRAWYIAECETLGQGDFGSLPYGYASYEDGERVLPEHRNLYRIRGDVQQAFPDPFLRSPHGGFLGWYQANVAVDGGQEPTGVVLDAETPTALAIEQFADWLTQRAHLHGSGAKRAALGGLARLLRVGRSLAG